MPILLKQYRCRCGAVGWPAALSRLDQAPSPLLAPRSPLSPVTVAIALRSILLLLLLPCGSGTWLDLIADSKARHHDTQQYHCQCAPQFTLVSRSGGPGSLRGKAVQGLRSVEGL
jgi:hypothetical protein